MIQPMSAVDGPEMLVGIVPTPGAVDAGDLGVSPGNAEPPFANGGDDWLREAHDQAEFSEKFGDRLLPGIGEQHKALGGLTRDCPSGLMRIARDRTT